MFKPSANPPQTWSNDEVFISWFISFFIAFFDLFLFYCVFSQILRPSLFFCVCGPVCSTVAVEVSVVKTPGQKKIGGGVDYKSAALRLRWESARVRCHRCVCVCVWVCVCVCVCVCVYIYNVYISGARVRCHECAHVLLQTHTYSHKHTYMYIYIHAYTCVYIMYIC